jgi:hypothetical protein
VQLLVPEQETAAERMVKPNVLRGQSKVQEAPQEDHAGRAGLAQTRACWLPKARQAVPRSPRTRWRLLPGMARPSFALNKARFGTWRNCLAYADNYTDWVAIGLATHWQQGQYHTITEMASFCGLRSLS